MTAEEFTAYVEANYEHFLHFVRKHAPSAEEAADTLQSALLRLWVNCDRIDSLKPAAYFFRALRNAINDLRDRRSKCQPGKPTGEAAGVTTPQKDYDGALERWFVATLRWVKSGLPGVQRQAFASYLRACGDRGQARAGLERKLADGYDGALHRAKTRLREVFLARRGELFEELEANRLWELVFQVFCAEEPADDNRGG